MVVHYIDISIPYSVALYVEYKFPYIVFRGKYIDVISKIIRWLYTIVYGQQYVRHDVVVFYIVFLNLYIVLLYVGFRILYVVVNWSCFIYTILGTLCSINFLHLYYILIYYMQFFLFLYKVALDVVHINLYIVSKPINLTTLHPESMLKQGEPR